MEFSIEPEDHWSRIAHLSAEDMLKSAVTEEKKFKHSPWAEAEADNPLEPKFWCQQEGLITMAICCKFRKNLFNQAELEATTRVLGKSRQRTPATNIASFPRTIVLWNHLTQAAVSQSSLEAFQNQLATLAL